MELEELLADQQTYFSALNEYAESTGEVEKSNYVSWLNFCEVFFKKYGEKKFDTYFRDPVLRTFKLVKNKNFDEINHFVSNVGKVNIYTPVKLLKIENEIDEALNNFQKECSNTSLEYESPIVELVRRSIKDLYLHALTKYNVDVSNYTGRRTMVDKIMVDDDILNCYKKLHKLVVLYFNSATVISDNFGMFKYNGDTLVYTNAFWDIKTKIQDEIVSNYFGVNNE